VSSDSKRFPQGWPLTRQQIETAYSESQKSTATFVLLYFPSKEEVYWKAIKKKSKSLEPLDDRIDQLRKTAMEFCYSRKLFCIDLTPALKARAEQGEKVYFSNDSHWNDASNRIVADEIYKQLVEKKIL
jgi:SGNH hydrolase-like domain, acetyltransferase AlgX